MPTAFQLDRSFISKYHVQKTGLRLVYVLRCPSQLLCLVSCRIIWQYALPLTVHPSLVLHRNVVLRESVCPASPKAFFSSFAVVSSSLRIVDSTNSDTSSVILEGLPLPRCLEMLPICCTRTKKAYRPLLLTTMPSSFSIFVMVGALLPLAWW